MGDSGSGTWTTPPPPKAYLGTRPGGELPDLGRLFQETMADFQDHFGDYLVAGAIQFAAVMVLVIVGVFVGYLGGMVLGIGFVFAMVGAIVGAGQAIGEDAAALLIIPLELTMFLVMFLGIAAFGGLLGAVMGPMNASLARAIAAHQKDGAKLEAGAAFSTFLVRPVGAATVGFALVALAVLGSMFCYVPALVVPLLFGFASSLVALHPLGGVRSLAASARFALAHPAWALPFGLVSVVLFMVASNVPVLGTMFATAFHVRAHRYVFGDGEAPILSLAGSSSGATNTQ